MNKWLITHTIDISTGPNGNGQLFGTRSKTIPLPSTFTSQQIMYLYFTQRTDVKRAETSLNCKVHLWQTWEPLYPLYSKSEEFNSIPTPPPRPDSRLGTQKVSQAIFLKLWFSPAEICNKIILEGQFAWRKSPRTRVVNDHFLRSLNRKGKVVAKAVRYGVRIKKYRFRFHKIWKTPHYSVTTASCDGRLLVSVLQ